MLIVIALPLPPGPKGKPIIGNLLDMPAEEQWIKATEWKESIGDSIILCNPPPSHHVGTGDVVHLGIAGNHIIFLNKYEDAINLLEKRSNIYSERPISEMCKL